jgi:hypothetical protein
MTAVRAIRWIILLTALLCCIAWSYTAIDHLLDHSISISQQDRLGQYSPASQPVSAHLKDARIKQKYWGRQSLFSVACSFFFLLATMMNWVLDGRRRRGGELK